MSNRTFWTSDTAPRLAGAVVCGTAVGAAIGLAQDTPSGLAVWGAMVWGGVGGVSVAAGILVGELGFYALRRRGLQATPLASCGRAVASGIASAAVACGLLTVVSALHPLIGGLVLGSVATLASGLRRTFSTAAAEGQSPERSNLPVTTSLARADSDK